MDLTQTPFVAPLFCDRCGLMLMGCEMRGTTCNACLYPAPVIPVNLPMRGFSNWYEYARHTRTVHVEQRAVGIGWLYDAYLPAGYVVSNTDLMRLSELASEHGCARIEVVPAPKEWSTPVLEVIAVASAQHGHGFGVDHTHNHKSS